MSGHPRFWRQYDFLCTIALLLLLSFATVDQGLPRLQRLWLFHAGAAIFAALVIVPRFFRGLADVTGKLLPFVACVAWIGLQVLAGWTVYRYRTEVSLLIALSLLYLFAATQQLCSEQEISTVFLRGASLVGTLIVALDAATHLLSRASVERYYPRLPDLDNVHGLLGGYSAIAQFVEIILPIVLWRAMRTVRQRWFWYPVAGFLSLYVVYVGSRMGSLLVVLEVGFVVSASLTGATRRRALPWMVGASVLAAVFVASFLQLRRTEVEGGKLGFRWEMAAAALAMWRDHPLTGVGLGNYPIVHPAYARFDIGMYINAAHNDTLQVLAEGGLVYLLLLGWLVAMHARSIVRHVWAWGLIAVWIHSCTDLPFQNATLVHWFCAVLAAAGVRSLPAKKEKGRGANSAALV